MNVLISIHNTKEDLQVHFDFCVETTLILNGYNNTFNQQYLLVTYCSISPPSFIYLRTIPQNNGSFQQNFMLKCITIDTSK